MASGKPKKFLFLGDSFTVGTGLKNPRQAFPFRLVDMLRKEGIEVAPPKLYGVDGHTTKHLLGLLDVAEPLSNPMDPKHNRVSGKYDLAVLSIGVNDLFRGQPIADYRHHFGELAERAVWFAGNRPSKVIVLSVPAWDAAPSIHGGEGRAFRAAKYDQVRLNTAENRVYNTRQGIAVCVDMFNAAARQVAEHYKIRFVDITDLTRAGALDGGKPDPSLFVADGIHYSGAMYEQWAERLLPAARKMI